MNNGLIDYEKLQVDKEDSYVKYNDELHKYWVKDSGKGCISVTTLIHQFSVFDEDFWSSYKALEALVSEEVFKTVKMPLINTKRFSLELLPQVGVQEELFFETKKSILMDWEQKREVSCIRGSAIHKELEMTHLSGQTKELQHLKLGGNFKTDTSNKIKLGTKGVYPELLLSRISPDGKLRLAGQADLIIVDDRDVYVCDYKTNKSIDKKSYFDRARKKHSMMKYPLNNLQDTNFWHYSLQLSTYAWMIQKINPEFNIKLLLLIHYDHDGNMTTHECEYLKKDVEKMLVYHKKQIEHEEFNSRNKKVVF